MCLTIGENYGRTVLHRGESMKKFFEKYNISDVNTGHIPHLEENILLISSSYGFSGLNCIVAGLYSSYMTQEPLDGYAIIIGIIMLCMTPISILDRRSNMCGMLAVVCTCIIHLALSLAVSYVFSLWWIMGAYICEVALCFSIIFVRGRKFRKQVKKKKP